MPCADTDFIIFRDCPTLCLPDKAVAVLLLHKYDRYIRQLHQDKRAVSRQKT